MLGLLRSHSQASRGHQDLLQREALIIAAREHDLEGCLREWTHFLRVRRPLREKYGAACFGTDHRTTDVVMEEKQRLFFEAKDFCATLARQALVVRTEVPEESAGPSRRLRLDLEEAIEDSDELLLRCARRGLC
eukprot:s212_g20.t1